MMAFSYSFKECLFDQLSDFNTLKGFSDNFFLTSSNKQLARWSTVYCL